MVEREIQEIELRWSLIFPWIKSRLLLTTERLTGDVRTSLITALNAARISQPVSAITTVSSATKLSFVRVLIGLILIVSAFGASGQDAGAYPVIAVLLGLAAIVSSYKASLEIRDASGASQFVSVAFPDRRAMEQFAMTINDHLASRSVSSTRADTDPIERLHRLKELLSSGAITEEEFVRMKRDLLR